MTILDRIRAEDALRAKAVGIPEKALALHDSIMGTETRRSVKILLAMKDTQ